MHSVGHRISLYIKRYNPSKTMKRMRKPLRLASSIEEMYLRMKKRRIVRRHLRQLSIRGEEL